MLSVADILLSNKKDPAIRLGLSYLSSYTFIHFAFAPVGSRSTPLLDTSGLVHELRLKQHGLRFPAFIFDNATPIRFLRVSEFFVEPIQRTQSQRALGVMSIHVDCAVGAEVRAFFKSAGTLGSGHSLMGSIAIVTLSPSAPARMFFSTLSQWLPLPSGSSGA